MKNRTENILPDIPLKNNFDFLRLLFACSVMFNHYAYVTGQGWWFPISSPMAVYGFFIISGFLVVRSFYSSRSIKNYFQKRARRILPAYILVVLLFAFGLSFLSDLPFEQYFSSPVFFKYLAANLSFMNFIQPSLPGVFAENTETVVNASLWTIKIEIMLYLSVPLIVYLVRRFDKRIVLLLIYLFALAFNRSMNYLYDDTGNPIYEMLSRQVFSQIAFFVTGTFILFYFDFFLKYRFIFLLIAVPIFLFRSNDIISCFYPVAWGVIIFCIAFSLPFLNNAGKYGDFSYGIYLFHFPIIQIITSFNFFGNNHFFTFVLVVFLTFLFAWLSWHLLEKRFLKRKKITNFL